MEQGKHHNAFFKKACGDRVGIDCFLEQFDRILSISDLEAGEKEEKSGDVARGENKCGDEVTGLLARYRV